MNLSSTSNRKVSNKWINTRKTWVNIWTWQSICFRQQLTFLNYLLTRIFLFFLCFCSKTRDQYFCKTLKCRCNYPVVLWFNNDFQTVFNPQGTVFGLFLFSKLDFSYCPNTGSQNFLIEHFNCDVWYFIVKIKRCCIPDRGDRREKTGSDVVGQFHLSHMNCLLHSSMPILAPMATLSAKDISAYPENQ